MKTNKIIYGGIAGAVAFFLLGWLVYGILLNDFMMTHYNNCSSRPMDEMIWSAMIISNLVMGFLIALAIARTNCNGIMQGTITAAVLGLLISTGMDLSMYSMSTMFYTVKVLIFDIAVSTVMWAVIGFLVSLVMFLGKK